MSNMSYCRHENTANDLADVVENWVDDPSELNEYELRGRRRIIELAQEIVVMTS
jgi:hypothetical protein